MLAAETSFDMPHSLEQHFAHAQTVPCAVYDHCLLKTRRLMAENVPTWRWPSRLSHDKDLAPHRLGTLLACESPEPTQADIRDFRMCGNRSLPYMVLRPQLTDAWDLHSARGLRTL